MGKMAEFGHPTLIEWIVELSWTLWYAPDRQPVNHHYRAWARAACTNARANAETLSMVVVLMFKFRWRITQLVGALRSPCAAFAISLLLAHKYCHDGQRSMKFWIEATGYQMKHLRWMEREYLHIINHALFIVPEEEAGWKGTLAPYLPARGVVTQEV